MRHNNQMALSEGGGAQLQLKLRIEVLTCMTTCVRRKESVLCPVPVSACWCFDYEPVMFIGFG